MEQELMEAYPNGAIEVETKRRRREVKMNKEEKTIYDRMKIARRLIKRSGWIYTCPNK